MSGNGEQTKEDLKQAVCEAIDRHGNEIIELGERILHHPETGFNESKTSALVAKRMAALGLEPQTGLALTGVKGRIRGRLPGRRTAAATMRRSPACSASRWGCRRSVRPSTSPASWCSSPCRPRNSSM